MPEVAYETHQSTTIPTFVGPYRVRFGKTDNTFFDSVELELVHQDGTYTVCEFQGVDKRLIKMERGFTDENGDVTPYEIGGGPKDTAHSSTFFNAVNGVNTQGLILSRAQDGAWSQVFEGKTSVTDPQRFPTAALVTPEAVVCVMDDFRDAMGDLSSDVRQQNAWQEIAQCLASAPTVNTQRSIFPN